MRKMTMLLTGSPVYFNEQIHSKKQKRSLPRKSINSREYFNDKLERNARKQKSIFSCCNGEREDPRYETKGFGLRPEIRPKVKEENYMDISMQILQEQQKMRKPKEKVYKFEYDPDDDLKRIQKAQGESQAIKNNFIENAELEEKERETKRMLKEALEQREMELKIEMDNRIKRERDEKGQLYIRLAEMEEKMKRDAYERELERI